MNNIWLAFITGLTTGGLSCFAVQGGLLASSLAQDKEQKLINDVKSAKHWQKVAMFIIAKLIAYTLLGAGLGLLGSAIAITPRIQGWLQIFAGTFMLLTAARILDIHPIFRRFNFQPPKWAYKLAKNESRSKDFFATLILGFLTVLIPCGTTQAMMILAVSSGNVFWGAIIMGAFVLGTSPVFFALGLAASELLKRKALKYIAATAIFILGLLSINTGQILRGSAHTFQNYQRVVFGNGQQQTGNIANFKNGFQEANITVTNSGYTSNVDSIKAGIPVKLKIMTENVTTCARTFTIPEFNISAVLPQTGTKEIEFTPQKLGSLTYTCSMGMYTGNFNVVP